MDHVGAISLDALPTWAMNAATTTVLGIVLRVKALAIAIGQPGLHAWIGVSADAVLAETAGTNHTAETAVVRVIQEISTVAGIPTAPHRLACAGICIERLAIWTSHVSAAIVLGHITFTMAMRLRIRTAGVDNSAGTTIAASRGAAIGTFAGASIAGDAVSGQSRRRFAANTATDDTTGTGSASAPGRTLSVGVGRILRRRCACASIGIGCGGSSTTGCRDTGRASAATGRPIGYRVPVTEITRLWASQGAVDVPRTIRYRLLSSTNGNEH